MKKRDIIGISISVGLCLVLAIASMLVPADVQTGVMFASYFAGYIAFMWVLFSAYQRFLVGAKAENASAQAAMIAEATNSSSGSTESSDSTTSND